jgi:serine/threonine protein kinase
MTVLWAATGHLQTSFDDSGETQVGATANPYFALLAGAAEEFHGSVISLVGAEVVAEFAEPPLAVRAAAEMQRRLVKAVANVAGNERPYLRVGIHQSSRETAARIERHSKPGQILVSRAVREAVLSETDVRCTWQGHLTMPDATTSDSAEKEDLFEVLWAASTVQATPAPAGRSMASSAPVLQRFDVLGELGRGGMGIVYKARDRETSEIVALKVLKPELLENPTVIERFKNEMRLARKITHKNVCRIHDFHRDDEVAYISMEYVEGESLRALLDQRKGFTVEQGLSIAHQLCAGLAEAHAQGVVHRDLKPQNVMMDASGKITIMDFGIARSVDSGNTLTVGIIGTPAYMAPEQAEGKPVDHRTDIYALGLLLYEVFTGVAAFSGETMVTVVMKQIMETPRPPRQLQPSLPANLERVILGCLEKSPDRRFASITELDAALSSGDGAPLAASTPAPAAPTPAVLPVPVIPPGQTVQILAPPEVMSGGGAASEVGPVQAAPPPRKRQWWKTAIGITAMGCAMPTLLVCLALVAIVWRGTNKKMAPTIQVSPDGAVTVAPAEPASPAKNRKDRKAKKAASDQDEQAAPPPPPTINVNVPGFNIPNIPAMIGKDGGVDVQEIIKGATQMKVQIWVAQGDKFMQQKLYKSAVEMYRLAAKASPDDQIIKNKLTVAQEAQAAADKK